MMYRTLNRTLCGTTLLAAALGAAFACSSDPEGPGGIGGDDDNLVGKTPDGGNMTGTGGQIGPIFGGGGNGQGGAGGFEECDGTDYGAEPMPVDMYIMLDQSTSMGETLQGSTADKWNSVVPAITSFVDNPAASQIRVGLQYFALPGDNACNVDAYATPEVPVANMATAAGAIKASIAAHYPVSFTPTGAALEGALKYMKQWAAANPERQSVVVLVTDGFPTQCEPQSISEIEALAKAAYDSEPRVLTFVVGIGEGFANLNNIAEGGGTGKAFLIESGDVQQQFLQAMLGIASTPISCDLEIPPDPDNPSQEYDYTRVSVTYTPAATGVEDELPKINYLSDCGPNNGKGWFYDHPTEPTTIKICPDICSKFAAGKVSIRLGCTPKGGIVE